MKNLPTMESIAGTYELKEKGGFFMAIWCYLQVGLLS